VPTKVLPDPETEPVVTVERAGEVLGISRQSAYEAVRRSEFPSLRFGHRIVVPTVQLLALLRGNLGLDPSSQNDAPAA
jgi:hypothetical protein